MTKKIKVGSLVSIRSTILNDDFCNGLVLSKRKIYSNAVNDYFVYKILCGNKLQTLTTEYNMVINEIQSL